MLSRNDFWNPLMSDAIAMTVATPMTMPSSASIERSRFAASAWRAIVNVSAISWSGRMGSLVAQRFDRVEARGARGRVRPEEHAHARAHQHAQRDRAQAERRRERAHRPHEQGQA